MLKHVLLASACLISTPVLAQSQPQTVPSASDTNAAPAQPQTTPAPQPPTATNPAPAPTAALPATPATPATAANQPAVPATPATPAPNAQGAAPDPAAPATAPAAPAPAPAGDAGTAVAGVVNSEFGSYDKNKDGKLSKAEFGAWMTALRTKADPSLKDDAANKAWITQAFGQADTDKSKTISKDELTNFLAQGQGQKAS